MSKSKKLEFVIILILILIFLTIFIKNISIFESKEQIRLFVIGFGIWAPLALIILQVIQVVIPFIPGGLLTLSGGFIFGKYLGTLYSIVGMVIGSFIVFTISKRLGRPFVEKIINRKKLRKYDHFFEKHGEITLFFSRLMPFFPHDIISYSIGLTSMSRKKFIIVTILGFLPHSFIHNYIGDNIYLGVFDFKFYLIIIIIILVSIIYLLRNKIKNYLFFLNKLIKKREI